MEKDILLWTINPQITMACIYNNLISVNLTGKGSRRPTYQSEDNTEVGPAKSTQSSTVIMISQSYSDCNDGQRSEDILNCGSDVRVIPIGNSTKRLTCVSRSCGNVSPYVATSKFQGHKWIYLVTRSRCSLHHSNLQIHQERRHRCRGKWHLSRRTR